MSKFSTLEDALELPSLDEMNEPSAIEQVEKAKKLSNSYKEDSFELHDEEMDEIANLAVEYGKDLHDLGMNTDVKNAGEIFNASSNMFKIAVDARNLKMEKRLKMMKLKLDKIKIDRAYPEKLEEAQEVGQPMDRSAYLAYIKELTEQNDK